MIERKQYLNQLISKKENGLIKIITGIRRCGKSYLLFNIYHDYLNSIGVDDNHIIELSLDDDENIEYRNPLRLGEHIRSLLIDKDKMYYVFIDEIQKVKTIKNPYLDDVNETVGFVDVLLGLMKKKNVDVYVTGSNSKMLSSDIVTEFRGRGYEIRIHPLSFAEFYQAYDGDKHFAWREYFTYGGMPFVLSLKSHRDKMQYLTNLFDNIYLSDILERHKIQNKQIIDELLDVISSSVGSLTNPQRIANTFLSKQQNISADSVARYLDYLSDAFLISKAQRYDIKGRKYIGSPQKYYFSDMGLCNARINFRQTEENHIMENIIYNELILRGFTVDVGIVEYNYKDSDGKNKKTALEVDFIASNGDTKYYIQSTLSVGEEEKRIQEVRPLVKIADSFRKIVIVKDEIIPWHDEKGIFYIGIEEFLLNDSYMKI